MDSGPSLAFFLVEFRTGWQVLHSVLEQARVHFALPFALHSIRSQSLSAVYGAGRNLSLLSPVCRSCLDGSSA